MIRRLAATALLPVLIVAGCSSSGHPAASPTTTGSSATGTSGAALATTLHQGLDGLTSAKIGVDAGVLASVTGQLKLDKGTATAARMTLGSGTDATTVIIVGAKTYAKVPAGQNTSGKPYVLVSSTSTNEFVRGLASTVDILKAASNLGGLADLATGAKSLTDKGTSGGLHHLAFTVQGDTKSSSPLDALLGQYSTKPVPVDLYLDSANRPSKVAFALSIAGSSITITVTLSDFNAPVTITAPAANQVAGG